MKSGQTKRNYVEPFFFSFAERLLVIFLYILLVGNKNFGSAKQEGALCEEVFRRVVAKGQGILFVTHACLITETLIFSHARASCSRKYSSLDQGRGVVTGRKVLFGN